MEPQETIRSINLAQKMAAACAGSDLPGRDGGVIRSFPFPPKLAVYEVCFNALADAVRVHIRTHEQAPAPGLAHKGRPCTLRARALHCSQEAKIIAEWTMKK